MLLTPLFHVFKQDDKRAFLERVEACVRESQETVYENEEGSSLRFTEPKPAHVCMFVQKSGYVCLLTTMGEVCG